MPQRVLLQRAHSASSLPLRCSELKTCHLPPHAAVMSAYISLGSFVVSAYFAGLIALGINMLYKTETADRRFEGVAQHRASVAATFSQPQPASPTCEPLLAPPSRKDFHYDKRYAASGASRSRKNEGS